MGDERPDSARLFCPRPATREEIALALGRARPDPLWLTALLGAAAMTLAGFLLYMFSIAASAMELKHSTGARPMRRVCRAMARVLVGIPPLCIAACALDRWRARRTLRELAGGFGKDFVEAARIQPLDVLQLDYPSGRRPDLVFRIGEMRALLLRAVGRNPGEASLPNTDFEIVRLRESRRLLRVVPHGTAIENAKHRDGTQAALSHPECEPFDVDWESLAEGAP